MEVKNPLFSDDPTPATPPARGGPHKEEDGDDEWSNDMINHHIYITYIYIYLLFML